MYHPFVALIYFFYYFVFKACSCAATIKLSVSNFSPELCSHVQVPVKSTPALSPPLNDHEVTCFCNFLYALPQLIV